MRRKDPQETWDQSNIAVMSLNSGQKIENLNIHARVTGIAWRKMIEEEIPEDAVQRLAYREYIDDGEWLEAVRIVT